MKQYYGAADMERFIGALTRYLEQYKAEGDTEADRNIEIAPSNDLMGFAKALDEVKESIDKGFGNLEEKLNKLGRITSGSSGPGLFDWTSIGISIWGGRKTIGDDIRLMWSILTGEAAAAAAAGGEAVAAGAAGAAAAAGGEAVAAGAAGAATAAGAEAAAAGTGAAATAAGGGAAATAAGMSATAAGIWIAAPVVASVAIDHWSKGKSYERALESAREKLINGEKLTELEQTALESWDAGEYYDKLTTVQEGQKKSLLPPQNSVSGEFGGNDELMAWVGLNSEPQYTAYSMMGDIGPEEQRMLEERSHNESWKLLPVRGDRPSNSESWKLLPVRGGRPSNSKSWELLAVQDEAAEIRDEYTTGLPTNPYMGADESMLLPQAEQEAFHEMTDEALGGVATPVTSNVVNNYNTTSEEGETQWKTFAPVIHMHGVTISSEYDIEEIGRRLADMLVSAVERGPH